MDFIEISNIIFDNRTKYKNVSDNDKINSFYMINKKLSIGKIKEKDLYIICQTLNNKYICRASALDIWFLFFKKINQKGTPYFWWAKNPNPKTKEKKLPSADKILIMEYENLTEKEYDFLYEHYRDDIEYKIKLLKRLE